MKIKEIWQHLWESLFPSTDKGFSIKNIMAGVTHISLLVLTFMNTDKENFFMILGSWQVFILTLIGVRAWEKNKGILTGEENKNPN